MRPAGKPNHRPGYKAIGYWRISAIAKYVAFVHEGARLPSVWTQLRGQIYLGSDAFVQKMQTQIDKKPGLGEIPRTQRRAISQPLQQFENNYARDEAMARAYLSGRHTMLKIAEHFGVHYSTVSRAVRAPITRNNSIKTNYKLLHN